MPGWRRLAVAEHAAGVVAADSSRFSLYGVSIVRPYEARSTVPLPGTAYDTPSRGCACVSVRQASVVIDAHAELEVGIARLDVVLDVERLLLDRLFAA